MHFFSTNKLVDKFNNNQHSQSESVKYLVALMLLISIAQYAISLCPTPELSSDDKLYLLVEFLIVMFCTVFGVYLCYKKSEQVASGGFLERFICLALPASVQAFILLIILIILSTVALTVMIGDDSYFMESHLFLLAFVLIYEIIFYRIIYNAISKLSLKPLEEVSIPK